MGTLYRNYSWTGLQPTVVDGHILKSEFNYNEWIRASTSGFVYINELYDMVTFQTIENNPGQLAFYWTSDKFSDSTEILTYVEIRYITPCVTAPTRGLRVEDMTPNNWMVLDDFPYCMISGKTLQIGKDTSLWTNTPFCALTEKDLHYLGIYGLAHDPMRLQIENFINAQLDQGVWEFTPTEMIIHAIFRWSRLAFCFGDVLRILPRAVEFKVTCTFAHPCTWLRAKPGFSPTTATTMGSFRLADMNPAFLNWAPLVLPTKVQRYTTFRELSTQVIRYLDWQIQGDATTKGVFTYHHVPDAKKHIDLKRTDTDTVLRLSVIADGSPMPQFFSIWFFPSTRYPYKFTMNQTQTEAGARQLAFACLSGNYHNQRRYHQIIEQIVVFYVMQTQNIQRRVRFHEPLFRFSLEMSKQVETVAQNSPDQVVPLGFKMSNCFENGIIFALNPEGMVNIHLYDHLQNGSLNIEIHWRQPYNTLAPDDETHLVLIKHFFHTGYVYAENFATIHNVSIGYSDVQHVDVSSRHGPKTKRLKTA